MISFQTGFKIYRFVKDTLSFTDTYQIWLSTVRNATIQNLDLMTAISEFEFEYFWNLQ